MVPPELLCAVWLGLNMAGTKSGRTAYTNAATATPMVIKPMMKVRKIHPECSCFSTMPSTLCVKLLGVGLLALAFILKGMGWGCVVAWLRDVCAGVGAGAFVVTRGVALVSQTGMYCTHAPLLRAVHTTEHAL